MPVASQASVKALTPEDIHHIGLSIVLSNTYHLYLRPGLEVISGLGGLHKFMGWDGPILTDSGGYQVFSLAPLRRVSDQGVVFRSHVDGSEHSFTPESVVDLENRLSSDIMMPLDECTAFGEPLDRVRSAMERTHRWAERSRRHYKGTQNLYGIVQGGVSPELRRKSVEVISSLGFEGHAIGGLSLGEPKVTTWEIVREVTSILPEDKPRYLMGVGAPEDVINGVALGIDMFDSALPTRVARNGALFTRGARRNIDNAMYRSQEAPVDPACDCYTCRNFSAAYLHHLFNARELSAYRLATIHNLRFMAKLFEDMRMHIGAGTFGSFKTEFLAGYKVADEDVRVEQKQKWLKRKQGYGSAQASDSSL
jgi:queuine tRNA-ribosyltransferase